MDTKTFRAVEVKNADRGEVSAVFSTFGVKDHDGDVTEPGFFEDGASVRISAYGHTSWAGALPVGKGTIRVTKGEAVMDGRFFLNTTAGHDTFQVVKELAESQEWSYGFDILDGGSRKDSHNGETVRVLGPRKDGSAGGKVHEVSPVLLGAGVGTRTLATKGQTRFSDEAQAVMAAVAGLVERAADVMAKRAEKGKGLGEDSGFLVEQVRVELKRLEALMAEPLPEQTDDLAREVLRDIARSRRFATT